LTLDRRYSLSKTSVAILKSSNTTPVKIDVFLSGELPNEYNRLYWETKQLLDEMKNKNKNISFKFINPFKEIKKTMTEIVNEMSRYGMHPEVIYNNENQQVSKTIIFPWAVVTQNGRIIKKK